MSPREFMGHCICDSRYKNILKSIASDPIDKVNELYKTHQSLKKNFKYQELQKTFEERYERERNGNTTN